MKLWKS